jgi:hypothetical protein
MVAAVQEVYAEMAVELVAPDGASAVRHRVDRNRDAPPVYSQYAGAGRPAELAAA